MAGPEEIEVVQPFSIQLVEDYGYPLEHIQTHPQWRVKKAPSDIRKEYPVDIAVFDGERHTDDTLYIIVECKARSIKEGRNQLENYLTLSKAQIGVWTNGDTRLVIRKIIKNGEVYYVETPDIPRYGQRVQDIGLFRRCDLRGTHNLKLVFRRIRNYLAANAVGITRDESLAQEIINLIFCKIYDERFTKQDAIIEFRAGVDEDPGAVASRVRQRFSQVKEQYDDVFCSTDTISLDDASITYVVGELQSYCLMDCARDSVADAFETFIGPSLKGSQGQFFTPRNVTRLIRELTSPSRRDKIVDPACGSGGFLIEALRGLWEEIEQEAHELGWPDSEIESEKSKAAIKFIRGIDKDEFLSKVAKAYMAIMGDGRGGVFCENSLCAPDEWSRKASDEIKFEGFNVVMTNPPFGKDLKISDKDILADYALGHEWRYNKDQNEFREDASRLKKGVPPQILFVERCLDLLKPEGRLGIVLPESMLCNPSHKHIVQYIKDHARIEAVISFHENLFQPYTHAKAAVVLMRKKPCSFNNQGVFMAIARWCGHDSRGREIPYDDVPDIIDRWNRFKNGEELTFDRLGFVLNEDSVVDNIYLPKFYNPEIPCALAEMSATHDLIYLGDLVDAGLIEVSTGHEPGKLAYGEGTIPFVRTSDIANWQIKPDPKHGLSEETYLKYKDLQKVEQEDILMVRDGTYLVGTCAMVSQCEERIVFQSHILKFKVLDKEAINPYLLLALLSSPVVKAQISAKRFTQDIIDTLGSRWRSLVLPVPKDEAMVQEVIRSVREAMELRKRANELSRCAIAIVDGDHDDRLDADNPFAVLNI